MARRGRLANRRPKTRKVQRAQAVVRCERKARHSSRRAAMAAKSAMRRRGKMVGLLEPYLCGVCDGWHLGSRGGGR